MPRFLWTIKSGVKLKFSIADSNQELHYNFTYRSHLNIKGSEVRIYKMPNDEIRKILQTVLRHVYCRNKYKPGIFFIWALVGGTT